MRKDLIIVAVISSLVASAFTATVFASGLVDQFPDVDDNAYYADYITDMRNLGVVSGYDNGNFGPEDYVTRGQVATMLGRYDEGILDMSGMYSSGIGDLVQLVCLGGIEFDIESTGIQNIYDSVCEIGY